MTTKTNQEKLDDLWWILCAPDGRPALLDLIAERVLRKDVPWFGFNGQPQPEGARKSVTLADLAGWHDANTVGTNGLIAGLTELVKQLSVAQGVTIDYAAIAKAVNDDAAARMKG